MNTKLKKLGIPILCGLLWWTPVLGQAPGSYTPLGFGGGGSPSGIAVLGNDVLVPIDIGGIRRLSTGTLAPNWTFDPIADTDNPTYDKIAALVSDGVHAFAGTMYSGQLYRWDGAEWQQFWKDETGDPAGISSLYLDARTDVLYVGRGDIQVRHAHHDQHSAELGNGMILVFVNATGPSPTLLTALTLPGFETERQNVFDMLVVEDNETAGLHYLYVATNKGVYRSTELQQGPPTAASGAIPAAPFIRTTATTEDCNARGLAVAEENVPGSAAIRWVVLATDRNIDPAGCSTSARGWIYRQHPGTAPGPNSWERAVFPPGTLPDSRHWDIEPDPSEADRLFACTHDPDSALYVSSDAGGNWVLHFNAAGGVAASNIGWRRSGIFDCRYLALHGQYLYIAGQNDGGLWYVHKKYNQDWGYLTGTQSIVDPDYWKGNGAVDFTRIADIAVSSDNATAYATLYDHHGMVSGPVGAPTGDLANSHWKWFCVDAPTPCSVGLSVVASQEQPLLAFESFASFAQTTGPALPTGTNFVNGTVDGGRTWMRLDAPTPQDWEFDVGMTPVVPRGVLELDVSATGPPSPVPGGWSPGVTEWLYAAGQVKLKSSPPLGATSLQIPLGLPCPQTSNVHGLWVVLARPARVADFEWTPLWGCTYRINSMAVVDAPPVPGSTATIWLGTQMGLYRYHNGTWTGPVMAMSLNVAEVEAVSSTEVYVAAKTPASQKVIYKIDVAAPAPEVVDNVQDHFVGGLPDDLYYDGTLLYVGTVADGLVSYNAVNARRIVADHKNTGFVSEHISAVSEGAGDGTLLVGTRGFGLWRIPR